MKLWLLVVIPLTVQAFSRPPILHRQQYYQARAASLPQPNIVATATEVSVSNDDDQKKTSVVKSVVSSKLFACVLAFGVGVRVGIKTAAGSATSITGRVRQSPVSSLLLAVLAVREVYRIVPAWAKPKRKKKSTSATDVGVEDPDDMTSLATLASKLQSLFNVASQKLASSIPPANMRASLYAVFQLFSQVKQRAAQERDDGYDTSGTIVKNPKVVLKGYDRYFDYADWAYDEYLEDDVETSLQERLATCGYELLRHDKTALPGRVAHYVAVSQEERQVLIGVKGSSNFEDLLTDCCGLAVMYTLDSPFLRGGSREISAHEGIYISSRKLADDLEPFVKYVVLPNGYNVVLVGHSLGAGSAALTGLLLRSRFPKLQRDSRLQVLAFASPPILDRESALACVPFVTTIVNNSDVIPRASLHNLAIMLEFMKRVNERLEQEGKLPESFKDIAAFMRVMREGKDGEMVMSAKEVSQAMTECIEKLDVSDPDFLYAPGRILHMYDLWAKRSYSEAEEEVEKQVDDVELKDEKVKTAERLYEGNGTAKTLKVIEVDERMVLDHLSSSYRGSIRSLLSLAS